MNKYRITFHGCTKGAIGIHYQISELVETDGDIPAAVLKLYDKYDHITNPHVLMWDEEAQRFGEQAYGRDGEPYRAISLAGWK